MLPSIISWIFFIVFYFIVSSYGKTDIFVGGLFMQFDKSLTKNDKGIQGLAAFIMATKEINAMTDILPNYNIKVAVRDPLGPIKSLQSIVSLENQAFNGSGMSAYIGALGDRDTQLVNTILSEEYQKVQICTNARTFELSLQSKNPYKIRTVPGEPFQGMVVQDIVTRQYGYSKVSVFYTNDDTAYKSRIELGDGRYGEIEIISEHTFSSKTADLTKYILEAKSAGAKIFIIMMDMPTAATLLEQGYKLGLFHEGTQVFGAETLSSNKLWSYMSVDADIPAIMKGFIGIKYSSTYYLSRTEKGKEFVKHFRAQQSTVVVNADGTETCDETKDDDGHFYLYREQTSSGSEPVRCAGMNFASLKEDGSDIASTAPHSYDAMYLLAYALHNLLEVQGKSTVTGKDIHSTIINDIVMEGVTGHIDIYEGMWDYSWYAEGDRESGLIYELVNFNEQEYRSSKGDSGLLTVGYWHSETGVTMCDSTTVMSNTCHSVAYRTKNNKPATESPPDIIVVMPVSLSGVLIAIGGVCVILTLLATISVIMYRFDDIMKVSQPPMLYFVLVGSLLGCGRVIIGGLEITDESCVVGLWLGHMSFGLVFGALYIKTWRVSMLLGNTRLKRVKITTRNVITKMCILTSIIMSYMIFMTFYSKPRVIHINTVSHNQLTAQVKCSMEHSEVHTALFAIEAFMLFAGTRLCWSIKSLPSSFNESKDIASVITVILLVSILVFPIVFLLPMEAYFAQFMASMSFAICIIALVIVFFGMKVHLLRESQKDQSHRNNGGVRQSFDRATNATITGKGYEVAVSVIDSGSNKNEKKLNRVEEQDEEKDDEELKGVRRVSSSTSMKQSESMKFVYTSKKNSSVACAATESNIIDTKNETNNSVASKSSCLRLQEYEVNDALESKDDTLVT